MSSKNEKAAAIGAFVGATTTSYLSVRRQTKKANKAAVIASYDRTMAEYARKAAEYDEYMQDAHDRRTQEASERAREAVARADEEAVARADEAAARADEAAARAEWLQTDVGAAWSEWCTHATIAADRLEQRNNDWNRTWSLQGTSSGVALGQDALAVPQMTISAPWTDSKTRESARFAKQLRSMVATEDFRAIRQDTRIRLNSVVARSDAVPYPQELLDRLRVYRDEDREWGWS